MFTRLLFHVLLRVSYSTERGAAAAYAGHAAVSEPETRDRILAIRDDELAHRRIVEGMLDARGLRPNRVLDAFFGAVGFCIGVGCRYWGHWASAVGASLFEIGGILEYERLAALARRLNEPNTAEVLDEMALQERQHKEYFAQLATTSRQLAPKALD